MLATLPSVRANPPCVVLSLPNELAVGGGESVAIHSALRNPHSAIECAVGGLLPFIPHSAIRNGMAQ